MILGHPISTGFHRLTGCQRDPVIEVSYHGIIAKVYDYLWHAEHGPRIWSCSVKPGFDYLALDV